MIDISDCHEPVSGLLVAGVDEVGRGPLAGPVVAGAVVFGHDCRIAGLTDSKKLSSGRREQLSNLIIANALAVGIGSAQPEEIDQLNILQASLLAMERAVLSLDPAPQHALVDGAYCPKLTCTVEAIIKGDSLIPAISAASIIAKVYRDKLMVCFDEQYPGYGFARHKGYATTDHLTALKKLGACEIHRRSFSPVAACMIA